MKSAILSRHAPWVVFVLLTIGVAWISNAAVAETPVVNETQKLLASDKASEEYFGNSVALDGDTAVIGALGSSDSGRIFNGAAYVFTRVGGIWIEQAKLLASDKADWNYFGGKVALDGDTAVIGASRSSDSGTIDNGAAYVFTRVDGIWTEQAKLLASDKADDDAFGSSVALDGDTAVIGAHGSSDSGTEFEGAAYVFTRVGGIWTEQAKLLASDKASGDLFGYSVALDGDTAVIGAHGSGDSGTTDNGAAYVFTRVSGIWTEQAKLLASDKANYDWIGTSVVLDGDTAVIGAEWSDDSGTFENGAAYVFTRVGGIWTEQAKLLASDKADDGKFGFTMALDGDTAVIGAFNSSDSGTEVNAGYVFTRVGGIWSEQGKLLASDKAVGSGFRGSMALDGDTAVIGAGDSSDGGTELNGAAYVFDVSWVIPAIDIAIDIKPGNKRNVINPRARGGIWVAILSDTNADSPFDPLSQVDIPTVEFGPDGAKALRYRVKDRNKDGLGDLLLRFKIPETGIACGDNEATLSGDTFVGQSITGTDTVKTVGCNKAKKAKKKRGNYKK